jgi:hypothetical protein
VARLLTDDTLGDANRGSRGRKASPQRVTGYLARVEPSAEGVAFQHERHRLFEIAETAGCTKASASDYRRGKRTPHVSTWAALGELVGVGINVTLDETRPALTHHKVRDGSARHAEQ